MTAGSCTMYTCVHTLEDGSYIKLKEASILFLQSYLYDATLLIVSFRSSSRGCTRPISMLPTRGYTAAMREYKTRVCSLAFFQYSELLQIRTMIHTSRAQCGVIQLNCVNWRSRGGWRMHRRNFFVDNRDRDLLVTAEKIGQVQRASRRVMYFQSREMLSTCQLKLRKSRRDILTLLRAAGADKKMREEKRTRKFLQESEVHV
ncbi:unnamed protein product [Trichogramma brassicae]|uniref:Uncharacterized protein n=1 Tax=Trichogramma brassicae TaxID=86971 RepID=A0A6H5I4H6_9HYME|nr:unnamed protein product [Trichogramma brassicae]